MSLPRHTAAPAYGSFRRPRACRAIKVVVDVRPATTPYPPSVLKPLLAARGHEQTSHTILYIHTAAFRWHAYPTGDNVITYEHTLTRAIHHTRSHSHELYSTHSHTYTLYTERTHTHTHSRRAHALRRGGRGKNEGVRGHQSNEGPLTGAKQISSRAVRCLLRSNINLDWLFTAERRVYIRT